MSSKITNYINVRVRKSEGQKEKLKQAFESNCESNTIRRTYTDLHGEDVSALTKSQLDRLAKAHGEKKGMTKKYQEHDWLTTRNR